MASEIAEEFAQCNFEDKTIIYLIGGPGSGKGTMSELIQQHFDTGYMSAGDLLRAEAASGSELGAFISEQLRLGNILPQEITIGLLKKEIARQNKEIYLIDGFPRKLDQAQTFQEKVCQCAIAISLDAPDEVMVDRLMKRSANSTRSDDNPETIKHRLAVFHDVHAPVLDYLNTYGVVKSVDADRPISAVFGDIDCLIKDVLKERTHK